MTSSTSSQLVIDSNVWISALVFGGQPRRVFEQVVIHGSQIVASAELFSEIRRVLTQKFPDFLLDFEALVAALQQNIIAVALGSVTVTVCRDPDDNMVLETALISGAEVIISGDKDLLSLSVYKTMQIVTPAAWLGSV